VVVGDYICGGCWDLSNLVEIETKGVRRVCIPAGCRIGLCSQSFSHSTRLWSVSESWSSFISSCTIRGHRSQILQGSRRTTQFSHSVRWPSICGTKSSRPKQIPDLPEINLVTMIHFK
jgi:hypothetical protein